MDKPTEDKPIEIETDHHCLLAGLTAELESSARDGVRGSALADEAIALLDALKDGSFGQCCAPKYLALAPNVFDKEVQLPIACADPARLDTRVLLWPIGAKDGQHPHCDGWATFITMRGTLGTTETLEGEDQPERPLTVGKAELLEPKDGVSHHIHNRGSDIGLTIHIFGT